MSSATGFTPGVAYVPDTKKTGKRKTGRPSKRIDDETLMVLYSRHSAKTVAGLLGVSEATVRHWLQLSRASGALDKGYKRKAYTETTVKG